MGESYLSWALAKVLKVLSVQSIDQAGAIRVYLIRSHRSSECEDAT